MGGCVPVVFNEFLNRYVCLVCAGECSLVWCEFECCFDVWEWDKAVSHFFLRHRGINIDDDSKRGFSLR